MSPREFDAGVVQARLTLIRDLLDDLESVGEVTVYLLQRDRMLRHGVERVLGQLVELAVSINGHLGATLLVAPPRTTAHRSRWPRTRGRSRQVWSPDCRLPSVCATS